MGQKKKKSKDGKSFEEILYDVVYRWVYSYIDCLLELLKQWIFMSRQFSAAFAVAGCDVGGTKL